MAKKRKAYRFLTATKGDLKPRKFLTLDLESKADDSQEAGFTRPFMVGVYDPQSGAYQSFRDEQHLKDRFWGVRHYVAGGCVDKAMNLILQPQLAGYDVYAHNGGNFDYLFLLRWLRMHADEYGFEIIPVASSIQLLKVWKQPEGPLDKVKLVWRFLDSVRLLPMSLAKACETFGLPGKVEHDLNMHEDDPRWEAYLRQDCVALADVLNKSFSLIENTLGGEVGITAPSTSMKLYRRRFMGTGAGDDRVPKLIPREAHWKSCADRYSCDGCLHEWVRKGYYGGRTEPHATRGENLRYYDRNSSYVAAMTEKMPGGEHFVEEGEIEWAYRGAFAGFAECTVEIPESCEIPPLPYRCPETEKLLFPAGVFSGVWSLEELALLDHPAVKGRIVHVVRCVWFKKANLFSSMVGELWKLRDKSLPGWDKGLDNLAKLMGNSLYGKFGMSSHKTTITIASPGLPGACFLCRDKIAEGEVGTCTDCLGSKSATCEDESDVWYQKKYVEAPYIIPQIAAHITALARVALWRFAQAALEKGGKIYYMDTDSVITDVDMPSTSELGGWKDEHPGHLLKGTFLQPKVYMLESEGWDAAKVTMKGFPRDMRTKENLEKLQAGETLSWGQLEKVRTLARLGFSRGPRMRDVTKSFQHGKGKRVLQPDGVSTRPIAIQKKDSAE